MKVYIQRMTTIGSYSLNLFKGGNRAKISLTSKKKDLNLIGFVHVWEQFGLVHFFIDLLIHLKIFIQNLLCGNLFDGP